MIITALLWSAEILFVQQRRAVTAFKVDQYRLGVIVVNALVSGTVWCGNFTGACQRSCCGCIQSKRIAFGRTVSTDRVRCGTLRFRTTVALGHVG